MPTAPQSEMGISMELREDDGLLLPDEQRLKLREQAMKLHEDDGYGQPGESIEARADGSETELVAGYLPDDELQAGPVLAEYGETYEEAARRQGLEVQAEREQRSAHAIAHERELDIIKEQYDQAGKNILGAVAAELKGQLRRLFGIKK